MPRSSVLCLLGALGIAVAASCGPGPISVPGAPAPYHHGDGLVGRYQAALEAAPRASMSFDGADRVSKYKGAVLIDAPEKVKGLPEDAEVRALATDPAVFEALQSNDEAAAAKMLRELDVRVVLLHHSMTESIDRGGTVLARLYHHDHLAHFTLFRVGEDLLYYKVLDQPIAFPPQLAQYSIAYLRHRLKGNPPVAFPNVESEQNSWTFVAVLRGYGLERAVALRQHKTIQGALEELVTDLEKKHRRNAEMDGERPLRDEIDDLSIELHRVVERAYVEPRSEPFLQEFWEMGIDGAYVMNADSKERGVLPGPVSYTRSIRSADSFLRQAAKQGGMSERRPWRDKSAYLEVFRTIHFAETHGRDGLVYLYRGVPAYPMSSVTVASMKEAVVHAGDWYLSNMHPDGHVVYKMWPSENRYSNEYNLVRHTLATWNLAQAWEMDPTRADFLEGARRALDFTQRFLVKETDPNTGQPMAYYSFKDNQKLGTVVVNLLGIVDLARATQSTEWDEQLREMGRFILFMQEDNGRFNGYHVDKDHPYYQAKNDIVPGEAALALIYLAEYFDDDSWIETLPEYFEYYKPWYSERAVKADATAPWPKYTYDNDTRLDLVQFGPWTVMAANAYHRRTGDEDAAAFGLEIARWMIETYEWTEETAPFPDYIGGYYKLPGELPAMQAFCYAEGVAAAYTLALRFRPEEAAYFEQHTRESMRFGLQMQYNDYSTYAFSRPDQVDGGIRYAMNETKVRIDYVHHGLSSFYQWVKAAETDPNLDPTIKDGPVTPMQARRKERQAKLAEAVASGDAEAVEAALPPWGKPRRAVPHMRFRYPENAVFPVGEAASKTPAAAAPATADDPDEGAAE